jgi:hypothetical protein
LRALPEEAMMIRKSMILMVLLSVGATIAAAEGIQERFSFRAGELTLANLVGGIRVEQATAGTFEVVVTVLGKDAVPGKITFERTEGEKAKLAIKFPLEKDHRFVYPAMGAGSSTTIEMSEGPSSGWHLLEQVFSGGHRDRVKVSGSGSGLQIWADVVVKVPVGKKLEVRHGVGAIDAQAVTADLLLDSHNGPVSVRQASGAVSIDTGSGEVHVSDAAGDLSIDTGSGEVDLERCRSSNLKVDTGSGAVRASDVECDAMLIDTGSGDITTVLKRMGNGKFVFDTGSGSVDLSIPTGAAARFHADSGSGDIDVNLPGIEFHKGSADDLNFRTGDGGATVDIDTGSGAIKVGLAKP